jgi:hypothetical protein
MKVATGIPPHSVKCYSLTKRFYTCIETLKEVNDNIRPPVKQAFEETALEKWPAWRGGRIILRNLKKGICILVDLNLKVGEVRQALPHGRNDTDNFEPPHQEEQPMIPKNYLRRRRVNETPVNYRFHAQSGRFCMSWWRFKLPLKAACVTDGDSGWRVCLGLKLWTRTW